MMVSLTVRKTEGMKFVGVVDPSLLGKVYRSGIKVLDVSEDYYSGEVVDLITAMDEARTATIAIFIGNEVVEEAMRQGLIDTYDEIDGVKYAQMYNL
ncbi:MAG: DUF424 family protein [Thermoprotei archaeon]